MSEQVRILCVDDEPNVLRALERVFIDDDYEIITASSGVEGLDIISSIPGICLVISDYRMPGMNGVEFLKEVYARCPDTIRIVLSGYADTVAVVEAINEGKIYKFIPKPWNDDELRVTVDKAIDAYFLKKKNDELSEELRAANEELVQINQNLERLMTQRIEDIIIPSHSQVVARETLKQLPVCVVEIMSEGLISQVNDEVARLFNCIPVHTVGARVCELFPEEFCSAYEQLMQKNEYSGNIRLNGVDYVIRGRRLKVDEGNDVVLVMYPGGIV